MLIFITTINNHLILNMSIGVVLGMFVFCGSWYVPSIRALVIRSTNRSVGSRGEGHLPDQAAQWEGHIVMPVLEVPRPEDFNEENNLV